MDPSYDLDAVVIGGGTFGCTLAQVLATAGRRVGLWVRSAERAAELNTGHINQQYLPGQPLAAGIDATSDLAAALGRAPNLLLAVPAPFVRSLAREMGSFVNGDQVLIHAVKGLEPNTGQRISEVLREETCLLKLGMLTGPTLAGEVLAGFPAGALIASPFDGVVDVAQALFAGGSIRLYGGRDLIGAEVAASLKNVIAVGVGVTEGLGFGENARALLAARGLSEMTKFGLAEGGREQTFLGLAGAGDLMVTTHAPMSSHRQLGLRLARNESLEEILRSRPQVLEGVPTARAVTRRARGLGLDVPILSIIGEVLFGGLAPADALPRLLAVPPGEERERPTGPRSVG